MCIISHWDICASTFCIYFAKDDDAIDFIVNLFCLKKNRRAKALASRLLPGVFATQNDKLLCFQAALIQHIGNLRHIRAVVHVEQNIQAAVP